MNVSAAVRVAIVSLCIGLAGHSGVAQASKSDDGADPVIQESKTSRALEALAPRPMVLGEGALLLGIALAFALPLGWWLVSKRTRGTRESPSSETDGRA